MVSESGEIFTWGCNREGQLGYGTSNSASNYTPRVVEYLKGKDFVRVAAAKFHTICLGVDGEVIFWFVGLLIFHSKGKVTQSWKINYMLIFLVGLAALVKREDSTLVQVYTWGHRLVTPRRVVIARNLKKSGNTPLKFHRSKRLHVVSIAAGMVHSMALTDDGAVFYWDSSDTDLRCQQVIS